ncbi:MAG: sigma-70 family RNA polymerase sigma factor [Gemmataceae bacterium]
MPDPLQSIVDRIRLGEPGARRELLDAACDRLRRLAAHILAGSFPALAGRHEVDSVVSETWLRLARALDTVEPASAEHFFRLAAQKVRQVLFDLVERDQRSRSHLALGSVDGPDVGGRTLDPARLAAWTEFHRRAAELPDDERAVFDLHYYLGLPQAEVAAALALHPRKVSRLWVTAADKLADGVVGPND